MRKRKRVRKTPQKAEKVLDRFLSSEKRGRGRPARVRASEIQGRADNYRLILGQIWGRLREPLLKATTQEEVTKAFEEYGRPYAQDFVPVLSSLILKVISDVKFPKRPETQIGFLADSLAGVGWISARRSRDICERERNKKVNYIIRQDYYIECTCYYKGPALYGKCPKCGTDKLSDILSLQKLMHLAGT